VFFNIKQIADQCLFTTASQFLREYKD